MTPDAMAQIGRALYGERWQTSLATDLNVADRTMRRWLAHASAIPQNVEKELRRLLTERLARIGGMIGYSVNTTSRLVFHHPSAACFRYDDAGHLTLLNPQVLAEADVLLATLGAVEALSRESERDPQIKFTWQGRAGRAPPTESQIETEVVRAIQFAQKLSDTAIDIVGASNIELNEKWARDPKIVALSILCRTICNFRGAMLLVQQESVVEARVLVRLIYENLLWIGALRERGDAFVNDMREDDAANRKALGLLTLERSAKHGADVNGPDALRLRSIIDEIAKQFPGKKKLQANQIADAGVVGLSYVEYRKFSLDAVHCSITALGRHVSSERTRDKTELMVSVIPQTPPAERLSTVLHACRGLIGVAVGTNEMLGFTSESNNVAGLVDEFEKNGWTQDT